MSLPISSGSPVTLNEIKAHLNIEADVNDYDDELQFFLDTAAEWIATQVSDVTPAPVQYATGELVRHMWDTQRGPAAVDLDDESTGLGVLGFGIPNRVTEMLAPYLSSIAGLAPVGSFPDAADWPDPVCW